jgi:hypothetical protein
MVINGVREFMGFENLTPPKLEIDIEGNQAKIEELKKQIKTFTLLGEGEKPKFLEDMELFLDELDPARLAETLKGSTQVVNEFTADLDKAVTDFFAKQLSAGQAVGKLVVDSYKKFTDTITDFVMQGKASFADLFRFIRQELVRLYVQEKITTPLFTALGLKQKQGGGQVVGGTPYMVGEKGAELFIPSTSGNIISASDLKNAAKSSPTAEPINVNFNIQATDASGFDQLLSSRKNQIVAMISQAMNQKGKAGLI